MADGKDLSYVRVTLKDADGNRLTQDEQEIQVETDGVELFWQWEAAIHARKTRSQIPNAICIAELRS